MVILTEHKRMTQTRESFLFRISPLLSKDYTKRAARAYACVCGGGKRLFINHLKISCKIREEIFLKSHADFEKQICVDAVPREDIIHIASIAMYHPTKPRNGTSLTMQLFLDHLSYVYRLYIAGFNILFFHINCIFFP